MASDPHRAAPEAELAAFYRQEAAKLRWEAESAETEPMRLALLDAARQFEQLAEDQDRSRPN